MTVSHPPSRLVLMAVIIAAIVVPAILQGEVLYLKDGSEIRGRIEAFGADTLVFAPSFGGRIHVFRGDIVRIVFDETAAPAKTVVTPAEAPGTISLTFKDDKVTSKIAVKSSQKSREAELVRANWIQQIFVVGRDTVFTSIDSTMDKTIYSGHEKEFKNTMELEDVQVVVAEGVYRCVLIVRNLGADEFEDSFNEGPIEMRLEFETVGSIANQTTTLRAGIKKGFLRSGSPRFYLAD
jgi:hypothetical protein